MGQPPASPWGRPPAPGGAAGPADRGGAAEGGSPLPRPASGVPISSGGRRTPWGILDLIGTVVVGLVLGLALVVVSVAAGALLDVDLSGSGQFGLYGTEVYLGLLVAGWAFGIRRHGAPWRSLGLRPVGVGTLLAMVPLGFVLLVVNLLVLIPFAALLGDEDAAEGTTSGPLADPAALSGADVLWLALPIAVVAPVVEEVLFRGLLYRYLRGRFGRRRVGLVMAVIVSAAIFGVLHVVVPPIFVMGLVLAALAERYDSLLPGIVLHATNNGLVVLAIAVAAG